MEILYINACVREVSRTRRLAAALLGKIDGNVTELKAFELDLPQIDDEIIRLRAESASKGDFSHSSFALAKQFAGADIIVIAAPYWDLSFPACLKAYLEAVTVAGITFRYNESGVPIGLCRAKELVYVTTAGGPIIDESFGFGYVEALARQLYGIGNCRIIKAEMLDIKGNSPDEIIDKKISELKG